MSIPQTIANELQINIKQVEAAINLLDEGATVPFIARYRKEVTGSLSDTQLRDLVERLQYLRELEERRAVILKSIEEQNKLTPELKTAILNADNKTLLEDLYLPYKPKRRTKAQIAREAGLEPLALALLQNPLLTPEQEAENYINIEHNIIDASIALEGAKQILMEMFAENAELLAELRQHFWQHGILTSVVIEDKKEEGSKFSDYFAYSEAIQKIPSHRALALFRGRKENILTLHLHFPDETFETACFQFIAKHFLIEKKQRPADEWLWQTVEWAWKVKLMLKIELELMSQLRENAEVQAIHVFQENLKNLLMAAPAGNKIVMGLDPGFRTGVKVCVVDNTGKLLDFTTIFPHAPKNNWAQAKSTLGLLCEKYKVELISIGNGTASRETDKLVNELIKDNPSKNLTKLVVSEAGASVYSASALAAEEFPQLDVSYRGAVSIARRLQDPLAELVKIDPKSIGVGQYQHDVNQTKLSRSLNATLEDCVNAVGADINTASVPLLASISGLSESIARNIVTYREQHGRFNNREIIKNVPRLGAKTYEQAIGFLRIADGDNPLDASAVHPESYSIVEKILTTAKCSIKELMGNTKLIDSLNPHDYLSDQIGLPTVKDILSELNKPGRDPRPEFKSAVFVEGIETLQDLKAGLVLEGVVTNVTNFGAFIDIGVHQDGLVHISEMSQTFISDPNKVVKVGDIVKVRVLEVDVARKRISLSLRLQAKEKPTSKIAKPQAIIPKSKTTHFGEQLASLLKSPHDRA